MVFHCMPALKVQMKLFMKSSRRMDVFPLGLIKVPVLF